MPTQPTIIVRGGCAHVLAGQKQCRDCAETLRQARYLIGWTRRQIGRRS